VGLQAKRRWGPPAIQVPDPACRSERTHWWDSKRSEDGARQQSKSPIRLAGRKGLTGGTPSEAKMGPASNPSPRSGLPVGKDSLVGLQAKRRWGPPAIQVPDPACRSERTHWWDSKRSEDGARQQSTSVCTTVHPAKKCALSRRACARCACRRTLDQPKSSVLSRLCLKRGLLEKGRS
jgi:hypothetical protein